MCVHERMVFLRTAAPDSPVTAEFVGAVKECAKKAKEASQSVSNEHKDIHAAISKCGRVIDKVHVQCVSLMHMCTVHIMTSSFSLYLPPLLSYCTFRA